MLVRRQNTTRSVSGRALRAAAVNSAREVLESLETLPCLKTIVEAATSIVELAQEAQTNKAECQRLGRHAEKLVISLVRAQQDQGVEEDEELRVDLNDMSSIMQEVQRFLEQERAPSKGVRLLKRDRIATMVKEFEQQLDETFRAFVMRSNVSLRQSQKAMAAQLQQITNVIIDTRRPAVRAPTPPLVDQSVILQQSIPEGIYQIVSVNTGYAVQRGPAWREADLAFMVPQLGFGYRRQLWSIMRAAGHEKQYWIRSVFDGQALDLTYRGYGTTVGTYQFHGESWQTWEIEIIKMTETEIICRIKSAYHGHFWDSHCPKLQQCLNLHHEIERPDVVEQQWNLVLVRPLIAPTSERMELPRRGQLIQNRASKRLLTQKNDARPICMQSNISMEDIPAEGSRWHFLFASRTTTTGVCKVFHIVSDKYGSTLDFWYDRFMHGSAPIKEQDNTWWYIIPCDGATALIKNRGSGKLLCDSGIGAEAKMADPDEYLNPRCHWYIREDEELDEPPDVSAVYDPHLSLMNPRSILQSRTKDKNTPAHPDADHPITDETTIPSIVERLDPRRRREVEDAMRRETKVLERAKSCGCSSFVVGPEDVDTGDAQQFERIRLVNTAEEVIRSRKGLRCQDCP